MTTVSDNYRTVSRNTDDVAKYLKCYFGHDLSDDCRSLTAEKIFSILKDFLYESAFEKYLTSYILEKKSAELFENESPADYCARKFRSSGLIGQQSIFCREKIAMTEPLLKKQLKNWFGGVTPSRESVFLLAFALEMTGSELSDILIKGIRDKGINYKDPAETAAAYCMDNGLKYSDALRLLEKAEGTVPDKVTVRRDFFTGAYKAVYESLSSEEDVIGYLAELIAQKNDPKFSLSVKECFNALLEKLSHNAQLDKKISVGYETGVNIAPSENISFGTVERYIYSYIPLKSGNGHYRTEPFALYDNGNITGKSKNIFKESKWFFSTLLRRSDLQKMYSGEKAISRDTIITLAFFIICEENPSYNEYEYISEINDHLSFCRYEQLNFSYPYDLFIFICLQTDDPPATFRKIWSMSWIKEEV